MDKDKREKRKVTVGWGSGVGGGTFLNRHVTTSRKIGLGCSYKAGTSGTEYSESTPALKGKEDRTHLELPARTMVSLGDLVKCNVIFKFI